MSYAANQDDAREPSLRAVVAGMWPSQALPERGSFVATQVAALQQLGHAVAVAPLEGSATGLAAIPKYWRLRRAIERAAGRSKAQLLHGHYLFPTGRVVRSAARTLGIPYVVTAHGTDVANAEQSQRWRRWIEPVVLDAAGVVAVSEELASRIQALWSGVNPVVAHMGVDLTQWGPADPADREHATSAAGWTGWPRLVAVGNLTANKNHARLIDAVQELRAALPNAELMIIGDGPEHARLEAQIAEHRLGTRVRLLGRRSPRDIRPMYDSADVACLVSRREGFGIAGLEALASGVPLVVSNTAPVSDLVEDGRSGAIVDPASTASIARGIERAAAIAYPSHDAVAAAAMEDAIAQAARVAGLWQLVVNRQETGPLPA